MSLPYKYFQVNINDLLLDVKNPRFASSTLVDHSNRKPKEVDIINHLLKYADIVQLAQSIERSHCLHGSELITCYTDDNGQLIVAEGNRRVCACKLLINPDLIPKEYKSIFPIATKETILNIQSVTINLYPNKESVQSYLSDRHISGVKKWSALEKNNYYMNLFQQYNDINIVKQYTSDSLATVKNSIIKYQFFMQVFNVLNEQGSQLEIEKIDYLPLADRFMGIIVGNDPEVGLNLSLNTTTLSYSCIPEKEKVYKSILSLIGEAFLLRKPDDENPRIVGTEVSNNLRRKELIISDVRIPGLYDLIKEYKTSNGFENTDQDSENTLETTAPNENDSDNNTLNENSSYQSTDYNDGPFIPDKYVPTKQKQEYLQLTINEAKNFNLSKSDYDQKILEILRELSTMKVNDKPVACACLFRCLLEECARKSFAKISVSVKSYNENDLKSNLLYVNNNVIFNSCSDSKLIKIRTSIKDKLKDGFIDILNLYIHYPNAVDTSYLLDSWQTMKWFVIKCLEI